MKKKPITQREARRLQRRVELLEELIRSERSRYSAMWPGGVHLATINPDASLHATVNTARVLGHAVVCTVEAGRIKFFALPHPSVPA